MLERRALLFSLSLLVGAVGCRSKLTGNEGNLVFSYVAEDDIADFNKPIAAGAKLDVSVNEVGTNKRVTLDTVEVDDDAVMKVGAFGGNKFTLEGVGDGVILVSVSATTLDGTTVTDSVNMQARPAEVSKLAHTCVTSREGRYLVNNRILIPFELERSNGQPVIGYGYYPFSFAPMTGLTRDPAIDALQFMHLDTGAQAGAVTVSSDIDGEELSVMLTDPGEIDGAEVVLGNFQETDVGDTNPYYLLPTVGGTRVCQANTVKDVTVDTPAICSIAERDAPENGNAKNEWGWIAVTGISAGDCQFTVNYTAGNGGQGTAVQLSIPIAP